MLPATAGAQVDLSKLSDADLRAMERGDLRMMSADGLRLVAGESPAETKRPGALERGVRGFAQGLRDVPDALKQMQSRLGAAIGLPGAQDAVKYWDADIKARNDAYKQNVRGGQSDFDFGRMGGNLAFTAPIAAALPPGSTLPRAMASGAAGGSALGVLQPVTEGDFASEKLKQAGAGAIGGAIGGAGANMLGRAISPKVAPEVAALKAAGITPTPGQVLGGSFKSAEEKLASAPVVGQAIRAGQQRGVEQMNTAAINRALDPIGMKLPKEAALGRDAINFTREALGKAYDDALNAVGPIRVDKALTDKLDDAVRSVSILPKDRADQLTRIVQVEIVDRARNGTLTPEAMKAAESNLGNIARGYMRSADYDQRQLGKAIVSAQEALRNAVERQAPAGAADMVKAANKGWANFVRVQRASSYVGAEDGVFSAAQLQNAVRAADPSRNKGKFAAGEALMQDLSEPAKKVLGSKVPNSGTADRLGAMAALNPGTWPYIAAGIPASLMYTQPGQAAMVGLLTGRQGPTAGLLSDAARRLAIPGGAALSPTLQSLIAE